MKNFRSKLLLSVCALTLSATLAADTVVEEIIARINGAVITRSELQHSRDQARQEAKQQNISDTDIAKKDKDTLRDLIDQQLLIQKANDLGISADAEVVKRLDEMRKQMNLENMEDLEKAAQEQGVSFEEFKEKMKNDILMQRVVSQEVGRRLSVTDADVQQFYNQHKQEFDRPEQVALEEILVSTDKSAKNPSDDENQRVITAEAKARSVYDKAKAPNAKFEDLAKSSSDGQTAAQGGQLGVYKKGQLAPEIENKVFALKAGGVTEPIQTKQGFLILKVVQHTSAGIPPLNEVTTEVQNALYSEKLQPALRSYLTKLREEAFIELRPGFVDTGASPNQTRPVYTTASADAKEKSLSKKHKKLGIF
jgi:peptidyl-prolyl cis-trans isomerase SurA